MRKTRILVADDEPAIQKLLRAALADGGYEVLTAPDGIQALRAFETETPDLVILDIMMPGMDGLEVCKRIRASSTVPVMMLTAKGQDEDVLQGLKSGADDYVTKPFSVEVLVARVQAVLRRTKFAEEMPRPPLECGELCIDFARHAVTVAGKDVDLTATEYRILCLLAMNAGRVFTQDQLLEQFWGWEYRGDRHILQVAVALLRQKIGDDPHNPTYIATRVGIGYVFQKPPSP